MYKKSLKNRNHHHSKKAVREGFIGYLFMLPTVIGFSFFVAYPLISSAYYALTEWSGLGKPKFVGLENFKFLFKKDPIFIASLKATANFVILTVPTSIILGLFLAVLLNKKLPGIKVFRTIYYLPVVLPSIASLVLWKFIFEPNFGLANAVLSALHLPTSNWLASPRMAMPAVAITVLWGVGGQMIIFLSGLQSVPADVYEAAQVDGASRVQTFFKITIPMITPVLFLQLITGIIGAFQSFNQAAILMPPDSINLSIYMIGYSIFQSAFEHHQFGYATAQVWVLFFIIMFFTFLIFKVSDKYVYYESDNR